MPAKIITDEKFLPTKNFAISKIFWNLFRVFILTQVAQKYRPSSVRLNIWPTVNTYARCRLHPFHQAFGDPSGFAISKSEVCNAL